MRDSLSLGLPSLIAFALTAILVPLVRHLAVRWGCISYPTKERWNQKPIPCLGGVALFLGFLFAAPLYLEGYRSFLPLFLVTASMFVLGLYDDIRHVGPAAKLAGQFVAAGFAILMGYRLHFVSWSLPDILLTAVWIIGLTNAMNLLDNMDGLACGVSLIALLYLAFFFHQHGDLQLARLSLAIGGAAAGFLIYNFHPASIFMGNSGSLFLGSALGLLAVHTRGKASNVLSLVAVPTLILLVPILDTILVVFTRLLRGQPVSLGGRDHTSHRLVKLGMSEPHAVLFLYLMAAVSGAMAVLLDTLSYTLSLVLLPCVLLSFGLIASYLAHVEIISAEELKRRIEGRRLPAIMHWLIYQHGALTILLDSLVISFAYYLAFAMRFDLHLDAGNLELYLKSLPLVLAATLAAFFLFDNYRRVWRYTSVEDLFRLAKSVAAGTLLSTTILLFAFRFRGYSRAVIILYSLLLFLGIAGTRLSFRIFPLLLKRPRTAPVPVLIYGAGDGGEVLVKECRRNPGVPYSPIGFIDDDVRKHGATMLGLTVLGDVNRLPEVLDQTKAQGLILSSARITADGKGERILAICQERNVWVKHMRLDFVDGTES